VVQVIRFVVIQVIGLCFSCQSRRYSKWNNGKQCNKYNFYHVV